MLAAQCLGPTYTGDFHLRGADLRKRGLNRVGNLLVPNSNYCAFEDWIMPILDAMKREQDEQGARWTPSKVCRGSQELCIRQWECVLDTDMLSCLRAVSPVLRGACQSFGGKAGIISKSDRTHRTLEGPHVQRRDFLSQVVARLGKEIGDESSVCYWAWKNDIPLFCPALTDGSIGDMLFFHSYKNPGLIIDIVDDIRRMNDSAMKAAPRKTGIIILGGGGFTSSPSLSNLHHRALQGQCCESLSGQASALQGSCSEGKHPLCLQCKGAVNLPAYDAVK